jgi:serine/threonine protein kinase
VIYHAIGVILGFMSDEWWFFLACRQHSMFVSPCASFLICFSPQKPENILLGSDGHLVLTDFGLAKQFEETGFHSGDEGRALTVCGTQVCTMEHALLVQLRMHVIC